MLVSVKKPLIVTTVTMNSTATAAIWSTGTVRRIRRTNVSWSSLSNGGAVGSVGTIDIRVLRPSPGVD